jgi:hypothetical protein
VYCPKGVAQSAAFGSMMAANGMFYTGQGRVLLEFNPAAAKWTWHGSPCRIASNFMSFTQGPDGMVWAAAHPTCSLVSLDPKTKRATDHGRLDPKEHYPQSVAVDKAGWVYVGIGTARCNVVAYNPKTKEKRQMVDEADRVHGTGAVRPLTDGTVWARAGKKTMRLLAGKVISVDKKGFAPQRQVGNLYYGRVLGRFPDGREVVRYDMPGKRLRIRAAKGGKTTAIDVEYSCAGAIITSLGAGPGGAVYGSTCHPMYFFKLDTKTSKLTEFGPVPRIGGGNMCAIACQGDQVIGASYARGRLWAFDVKKPFSPSGKRQVVGLGPQELIASGKMTDGHFTYLTNHDVAFVCGDRFGASGTFTLRAPASGTYYLHVQPFISRSYCAAQLRFDGKDLGKPVSFTHPQTRVGPMLAYGPMDLQKGDHALSFELLDKTGNKPWCAFVSVDLSRKKRNTLVVEQKSNPRVLGQWSRDICRPRTALAHPDGKHVMMAGFAGYGLVGGGIGIANLETGETRLLTADKDLLAGHSPITLKALPNGNLVGGTSVGAPGGGHATATEAELFILGWATRKISFHTVPVPGDANIVSITVGPNGLVYGLSGNVTFFVFDPKKKEVVHRESLAAYGRVPRHALHMGPDGMLYALMSKLILRINPSTFQHRKLADAPVRISCGGALANGLLCFASDSHVWSFRVPGLHRK